MSTDRRDAETRRAVEAIARNCDAARVRRLLAGGHPAFTPAAVRELAGTSPEYQRHVLARAAAGDPNPLRKVAASLLVYETVAFREVVTRLGRAAGSVRQEARLLDRAVPSGCEPDRLSDRLLTLDLTAGHARRLLELLADLPTVGGRGAVAAPGRPGGDQDDEVPARLHAPAALGLVAKNVRDVAALHPEHRPTPDQKDRAVRLTRSVLRLARAARDAAGRAFGRADAGCRVRPARTPVRRVITHAGPDGDAVAAAWLAERFLFAGEPVEVLFVPRGRVLGAYRPGDCLVDVGNTHDPGNLFFDHKPPALPDRHDSCAARLVWDWLVRLGRPVRHLRPLVDVAFAGDSARERAWFQEEYAGSRRAGFHKALADARLAEETDAGVYRAVRRWLDAYHRRAVTRTG